MNEGINLIIRFLKNKLMYRLFGFCAERLAEKMLLMDDPLAQEVTKKVQNSYA